MSDLYLQTGLWRRSLGLESDKSTSDYVETLRASYMDMRSKTKALTSRIAATLNNLTIHDISHLDALWETADLIAGDGYPLNPMEGFVFGGAILLHDAALCFEAYEGGQSSLRKTLEWQDSFVSLQSADRSEPSRQQAADFAALRALHAKQAQQLGETPWRLHDNDIFIIDNVSLRQRYGKLIGLIASSHHWSIEELSENLPGQVNAPGSFPREWRVDPVKLACLLRCADASHLDERRAPDFLYALANRQGISADHWKSQNWLARVDVDQTDETGTSLLFTSNHDFKESDSDAWWVAYDAITLVAKELSSSNQLLEDRPQKHASRPFKMKKVSGAGSPDDLSNYVNVDGWQPCSAQIHISNVEQLVSRLGGESLYGSADQLEIALRELIQNSRDAIKARESRDAGFVGKIDISLFTDGTTTRVVIEDDGIGMSERVLSGPFLDFGTSFWASDLAKREFPGLISSGFQPIGRYGIGFYAVFMIAKSVVVSSRRWDDALDNIRSLTFPRGLTLRPVLKRGRPSSFESSKSTRIEFELKSPLKPPAMFSVRAGRIGQEDIQVRFFEHICPIVAGLDVAVYVRESNEERKLVHLPIKEIDNDDKKTLWLSGISFSTRQDVSEVIRQSVPRLRSLEEEGKILGLAALSIRFDTRADFLSVNTVGGLASNIHSRNSSQFVGFIDYPPKSAKRDQSTLPRAARSTIEAWAQEQVAILMGMELTDLEWCSATISLVDMSVDPYEVLRIAVHDSGSVVFHDLNSICNIALSRGLAMLKTSFLNHVDCYNEIREYKHYPVFCPLRNSAFLSLEINVDGSPKDPNSFIGCLYRKADELGRRLIFDVEKGIAHNSFGPMDAFIIRDGAQKHVA